MPLQIAVLTVSDTRELADDQSGATLGERIKEARHMVVEGYIVPDDVRKSAHPRADLGRGARRAA